MAYTPQLMRVRTAPPTPSLNYSPDCSQHFLAERLIQQDCASDCGTSSLYATPLHQKSICTSYGTLLEEPLRQTKIAMSTPSSTIALGSPSHMINKPLAGLWAGINVIFAISSIFILLQSHWFTNTNTGGSVGFILYCPAKKVCEYYHNAGVQELFTIDSLPRGLALILYTTASMLLCVTGISALIFLCIRSSVVREKVSCITGYLQLTAVVLYLTALMVFPVGLDTQEVKEVCGQESDMFFSADCSVGWSYAVAIAGSACVLTLPIMSHYIQYIQTNKVVKI